MNQREAKILALIIVAGFITDTKLADADNKVLKELKRLRAELEARGKRMKVLEEKRYQKEKKANKKKAKAKKSPAAEKDEAWADSAGPGNGGPIDIRERGPFGELLEEDNFDGGFGAPSIHPDL